MSTLTRGRSSQNGTPLYYDGYSSLMHHPIGDETMQTQTFHLTDIYVGTDHPDEGYLIEMIEDHVDLPDGFDFSTVTAIEWTEPGYVEPSTDGDGDVYLVHDLYLEVTT